MEELMFWLSQMPKPFSAWMKIERELLNDSETNRTLGSITMMAAAILQTIPKSDRDEYLTIVRSLAEIAWQFYEAMYKGDSAYFNDHRLGLRSAIKGLLASPHTGRPPSDDAMVKKNKAWSMPADDWQWLESQPNQSEIIRSAIALYRKQAF